jgi:UDP-glucose 4-epimerase
MKFIVTGGSGFIGSHLVDELLNKDSKSEIIILDNFSTGRPENLEHVRNKIKIVECDLSKKGNWENEFQNVDYVFHLAALADIVPSIQNPYQYFSSNVIGTFNVIEACKNKDISKFIYAASSSCYGIPKKYPTDEDTTIDTQYPYALTKRMGEELVMHWSSIYKIPSISLRLFNVYGPRSRTSGTYGAVFGVFLAQKIAKKPFTIVGDGNQTRDFTYVSDVAKAFIRASESDLSSEILNVGSGYTTSVNKLVELIGGINAEKVFIPKRPGEPDCTFADIKKIKYLLKWSPDISIEIGVKIVLENINYWKDAPVWTPELIDVETKDWFKYLS